MRVVIQRVKWARVIVNDAVVGEIQNGVAILLGIGKGDDEAAADGLAQKITALRIFADEQDKMNKSLLDCGGAALVVSQFTLYADCTRGRRPYFGDAEDPVIARKLCDYFATALRQRGVSQVQTGEFGAAMALELCNDGPVTIILES